MYVCMHVHMYVCMYVCMHLQYVGGLGLRNLTNMYIARKISFVVEMLNSDDNQVRFIARESLQLHMNKRKVNLTKSDDPSFGGYEVNEAGIVKKNSKQCLSKSQWVELNKLCARTRIQLLKTDDEFKIVLPGTSQRLQCSNYYKPLYEHLHQKQLSEWMELEFQGAIIRQEAFDMQCSQKIYKNNSLADKLVKFVTKAFIVEFSVPFDQFIDLCYQHKFNKIIYRAFVTSVMN